MTLTRADIAKRVALVALVGVIAFAAGWASRPDTPAPPPVATPSGVDIGFCQDMAVHHAQAVLMAQQALNISTTPMVRAVATQILIDQSQERGMLNGWLTLWDAPQLPSGPPMTWMQHDQSHLDHSMPGMAGDTIQPPSTMPGMATQPELDQLANARGPDFDALFLKLMIRHHSGGIVMASDARDHAALPEVRAAAGNMAIAQNQENAVMMRLLPTQ
jgi:uncharacterized protein (DUF305 family)